MTIFGYALNSLDIILVVIFALSVLIGYRRGLLISVVEFVRYVVGFSLCFLCGERLAKPVYDFCVHDRALAYINDRVIQSGFNNNVSEFIVNIRDKLPASLASGVDFGSLASLDSDEITADLLLSFVRPVLIVITGIVIFLVVYLLFFVSTGIIIHTVQRSSRKQDKRRKREDMPRSPVKVLNSVLGAVLSLLKTMIICFVVISLAYALSDVVNTNAPSYKFVTDSAILNALYNINPFGSFMEV